MKTDNLFIFVLNLLYYTAILSEIDHVRGLCMYIYYHDKVIINRICLLIDVPKLRYMSVQ